VAAVRGGMVPGPVSFDSLRPRIVGRIMVSPFTTLEHLRGLIESELDSMQVR
jgi:hypothetical protein